MDETFLKWFIIGICIAYVWYSLSSILTYIFGGKNSKSYEPFWLKSIIVIWGILAGIKDRK